MSLRASGCLGRLGFVPKGYALACVGSLGGRAPVFSDQLPGKDSEPGNVFGVL
jgi:hypothetical protein